jgi:Flp pilus assembly protein TadD
MIRKVLIRSMTSLALAGALFGAGGCQTRSLVAVRDSGDEHYRSGQYDAALTDYKEYVERRPTNPYVHRMMGKTYLKMGETGLAREQMYQAYAQRMEDDEVFADLCEALYADKKYDDLHKLLRGRTLDRGRMRDWALRASYAEKLGDKDEAQLAWKTAAEVDQGKSVEPQLGLAKFYLGVGDRERARKRLAMAYYLDPMNAEVAGLAKQMGVIVGPTYGVMPEEMTAKPAMPSASAGGKSEDR